MKKAAGFIAFVVALVLLGGAFFDWKADADSAPDRISQGFRDLHNDAAFSRDLQETRDRQSSEQIRGFAGAGFLIIGLVLLGSSRKRSLASEATAQGHPLS
jgi:hypothetical protein